MELPKNLRWNYLNFFNPVACAFPDWESNILFCVKCCVPEVNCIYVNLFFSGAFGMGLKALSLESPQLQWVLNPFLGCGDQKVLKDPCN